MARPIVRLNGVALPPRMIAAEAQHHPARTPAAAFESAARALIIRTLLLEEAARRGLTATPQEVTEGKRELDLFVDAMISIAREVEDDPELVLKAPHSTRTNRVDEVGAARRPVVRWKPPIAEPRP